MLTRRQTCGSRVNSRGQRQGSLHRHDIPLRSQTGRRLLSPSWPWIARQGSKVKVALPHGSAAKPRGFTISQARVRARQVQFKGNAVTGERRTLRAIEQCYGVEVWPVGPYKTLSIEEDVSQENFPEGEMPGVMRRWDREGAG